jgi:hypothetical protein
MSGLPGTAGFPAASGSPPAPRLLGERYRLTVVAPENAQVWRVGVSMPGEPGPVRDYGEELYEDVLAQLEFEAPEQLEPVEEDEAGM